MTKLPGEPTVNRPVPADSRNKFGDSRRPLSFRLPISLAGFSSVSPLFCGLYEPHEVALIQSRQDVVMKVAVRLSVCRRLARDLQHPLVNGDA
jgi:hypothetical protein